MKFSFGGQKKITTVLEIDGSWLKIVQAQPLRKVNKITGITVAKIDSSSKDKFYDEISGRLKKLKINPDFLTVSIPHQQAVIKNLELPSVNPSEVKDMVELQIGKQTPFAKEEIIYNYDIVSTNAEGYSRILLVIVHQDVIRPYLKVLEKADLSTDKIALSSEGLFAWHGLASGEEVYQAPYALIDIDYDKSDFTVIFKDNIIFCRNISIGALQSADALDKWQGKFIEEINHSIYAYHSEMINEEISGIVITGAEKLISGLKKDVLKAVVGLPVDVIAQKQNINLTEVCQGDYNDMSKEVSVSGLFGLALEPSMQKINLIPPELQIEKGVKEKGRDLYFFGIYLAFILATASSIFLGRLYTKEQYLRELKEGVSKVQDKVDALNKMLDETDSVKQRNRIRNLSLNFIYEKHKAILPDIYLTSIRFTGKDRLIIRGTSKVMSEIFKFVNSLEESRYFQDVKTKFVTTRKIDGKDMTEFEIICPLEADIKDALSMLDSSYTEEFSD